MKSLFFALACLSFSALSGCSSDKAAGSGSGDDDGGPFDLDAKNALWLANKSGKVLILYTYKSDAEIFLEVRNSPKDSTAGQYTGSRTGDVESGYELELDCMNKGASLACKEFGDTMSLECSTERGGDDAQLVCGSLVFSRTTFDDIAQD